MLLTSVFTSEGYQHHPLLLWPKSIHSPMATWFHISRMSLSHRQTHLLSWSSQSQWQIDPMFTDCKRQGIILTRPIAQRAMECKCMEQNWRGKKKLLVKRRVKNEPFLKVYFFVPSPYNCPIYWEARKKRLKSKAATVVEYYGEYT